MGSKIPAEITKNLKSFFPGPYPSWKKVPEDKQEYQWSKFQVRFDSYSHLFDPTDKGCSFNILYFI